MPKAGAAKRACFVGVLVGVRTSMPLDVRQGVFAPDDDLGGAVGFLPWHRHPCFRLFIQPAAAPTAEIGHRGIPERVAANLSRDPARRLLPSA
jgi:hypothetical protein